MTETQTLTLAGFLLARIAEDEEHANWASVSDYGARWSLLTSSTVQFGKNLAAQMAEKAAPHVARWHPARVLAECEAKRRIIGLHPAEHPCSSDDDCPPICPTCAVRDEDGNAWPCPTIRALALPYADHPDYRPEWRADA